MALIQPDDSADKDDDSSPGISLQDFALVLLRLVLAVPLFYYQLKAQVVDAWGHLWAKQDWPLLNSITEMGLPQSKATAVVLIFILAASPAFIVLGFLTRVNALLTFLCLVFFFISTLPLSEYLNGQTYVLFLGISAVLMISGSGQISLDGIFASRRRKKKRLRAQSL